MADLPRVVAARRAGTEPFTNGNVPLHFTLSDFWCWSTSDLLNSTTRGVLAEFLVAAALDLSNAGVREAWSSYDLATDDSIKIEVKSSAYLQSWGQRQHTRITFPVPKTRAWDADANRLVGELARQCDIYVFALLAHREKTTVNPLDVAQWRFYIASRSSIDAAAGEQRTMSLGAVERIAGGPTSFQNLATAIRRAFERSCSAV